MSIHSFGDLSQTSSQYHLFLITSILAARESYNEDPIKSLQKFDSSKVDPSVLPSKKFNHLIESLVFSTVREDNLKDIVSGGEKMQVRYMIGYNEKEKILLCAVRGSDTKLDWIQDANIFMSETIYDLPGKIHNGFNGRADQVPIQYFVNKIVNEGYRCVFTGHSLGGAVATLLAIRVLFHEKIRGKSEFSKNVLCVGFGTPAVGNEAFVKYVNNIYKENFHFYINKSDLIVLQTWLSSQIYVQFGKFVFLNENGFYSMSDTYDRMKQALIGVPDHHRIDYYLENIVKILTKDHQQDIYVDVNEYKTIKVFDMLFIPSPSIEKRKIGIKCDLTNGCATACNKYSVSFGNPKKLFGSNRILFTICCQNAEYIYKAILQLEGSAEKFVDIKAERSRGGECSIEFDFEVPKNQFRDAKGTLLLLTHFEEAKLSVEISLADFGK